MQRYTSHSSYPRPDAQHNLMGRTHYVDPDTLRFHKTRVRAFRIHFNGLLCSLVESGSLTMDGKKRGFRYVIFDIFGTAIERPDLDNCYRSKQAASDAMYKVLDTLDAKAITLAAIDRREKQAVEEFAAMRADVNK